jgi:hypothetical protein
LLHGHFANERRRKQRFAEPARIRFAAGSPRFGTIRPSLKNSACGLLRPEKNRRPRIPQAGNKNQIDFKNGMLMDSD